MLASKKIVLLGHFGVGKTSLIRKYVLNSFSESYKVTIGVHISKKTIFIEKIGEVNLIIWDVEGTKKLESIRDSYLLGTHGIMYVFDTTRVQTYENINKDIALIKIKSPDTPMLIIGNKVDITKDSSTVEKLKNKTIKNDYLTSAKTGENVENAFYNLAKTIFSS